MKTVLEVHRVIDSGREFLDMVKDFVRLPSAEATTFRVMKAHGMHLRVHNAEEDKVTYDSTVAATFLQP